MAKRHKKCIFFTDYQNYFNKTRQTHDIFIYKFNGKNFIFLNIAALSYKENTHFVVQTVCGLYFKI